MASGSEAARVTGSRRLLPVAAILLLASALAGAATLSLEQAGSRKAPDFAPSHLGERVTVRGLVGAPTFHFLTYTLIGIQDEHGGAVLQVKQGDTRLDGFRPGDDLRVTGTVALLAGMAVIQPDEIALVLRAPAPAPTKVTVEALLGYPLLGRLVETEGKVLEVGDTTAGAYMIIGTSRGRPYKLFLPQSPQNAAPRLDGYAAGDVVRANGLAMQYCPRPPYNRWFELLVHSPGDIVKLERTASISGALVVTLLALVVGLGWLWWHREGKQRAQRERHRKIYQLGEEILGCGTAEAMLQRTTNVLPEVLGVSRVRIYVHNRATKSLDGVDTERKAAVSIPLASPQGGTHAGAAACFHYRTLFSIPDVTRSPFPIATKDAPVTPKSLLYVPMMAQGDVAGVLELDQDDRMREFTVDEQALAQHLANQMGVAIRLLDQRSVQEQLFRTEKLAAVGRLISGVVNELRAPLAAIRELADMAREKYRHAERDLSAIAVEARKASQIVARLVSFAAEQVETRAVDVNAMLRGLIEFRELDAKAYGIKLRDLTTHEPLMVEGSQGQLEQVFVNLLVEAEQSLADVDEKVITVRTSLLGRRVVIEVGFTGPRVKSQEGTATSVLELTRSVIAGHGGEVRLVRPAGADPRFEIDLPWSGKERVAAPAASGVVWQPGRQLTVLLIEPDETMQRQALTELSKRGCRVVPVNNADTGFDLAQRMRFDLALCSMHSPGLNWVELSERLQPRVGAFALLSDGYSPDLTADFEGENRFVLPKPLQEADLDRVMRTFEEVREVGEVGRARTA